MESRSYPALKLKDFEMQSYVHRIILSEPRSKYLQVMGAYEAATNMDPAKHVIVEFDFNQEGLLSDLPHKFRFHLRGAVRDHIFNLEENISGSVIASQRNIYISNVELTFCTNSSGTDIAKLLLVSVPPVVVRTAGFKLWTRNKNIPGLARQKLNDNAKELKISVEIVRGWGSRSPVFEKMIEPDFKEGREGMVEITDMDEAVVKEFLQFLYCGKADNLDLYAKELLLAATKYMLDDLANDSECSLAKNLTETNVLEIYRLSILLDNKPLKDYCQIVFKTCKNNIVTSAETFKRMTKEFPELMYAAFAPA